MPKVDVPLWLAPMAGYTDRAMRLVCRAQGATRTTTEMISAKAVVYGDKKTFPLARVRAEEGECAIQLFGHEPDVLAEAAKRLYDRQAEEGVLPAAFDLNLGCPMPKITGNGDGSAMMRSPRLVEEAVRALVAATPLPVTVKTRLGYTDTERNAADVARAAEAGGASVLTLHGRTRPQLYGGVADREAIGEVVRAVGIPVIANGDVDSPESAVSMLSITGAWGIAVGRAAVGNPFLFAAIRARLAGEPYTPPTEEERLALARTQLLLAVEEKGEEVAVRECRKSIALYLRGFRGAAALRARVHQVSSVAEVDALFSALLESLSSSL